MPFKSDIGRGSTMEIFKICKYFLNSEFEYLIS
jgi:hypothetical protein